MEDNEARMRLVEMESRMSVLEESVNRAVGTLMPKVDALLAYRRLGVQATSNSRRSTSARTPASLVEMARSGDYEALLGWLATTGIDVQSNPTRTNDGDTALHVAASNGHVKAVMVLLGAGAQVNASGHRLRTPLHCAAAHGHLAVAQRLLLAGAQVDAEDADGHTPLGLAAGHGSRDVANLLLQKGAKPNEKAVSLAAEGSHWDLVEFFLQIESLINACTKEGDPLIVLAAKANRWGMVHLLLEKGASATKCKDDEECALAWASQAGQADAVRELLRRGAALNARQVVWGLMKAKSSAVVWAFVDVVHNKVQGQAGGLGLVHAGCYGRLEPLMALLKAGVNVNATDSANGTALYYAASHGHLACVRELLQHGADVNTKNAKHKSGNTPLHQASSNGHVECVRVLLDAGAYTTERNKQGKTPLQVARLDNVRAVLNGVQ